MLRVKVNDLAFENAKLLKDFSYFKQEMEIEKLNSSRIYENNLPLNERKVI